MTINEIKTKTMLQHIVEENQKMYSVVIAFDIQLQHQHYNFNKDIHTFMVEKDKEI